MADRCIPSRYDYNVGNILNLEPTMSSPMSLRLDESLKARLRTLAVLEKRSVHSVATEAVQLLVEQRERAIEWAKSCDAAAQHFDETGLHVTHDEVTAWLSSLDSDKPLPIPACHG